MLREHEITLRVRYRDADPMGLLHHANYFTYFEIGRTELLCASGGCYRRMEEDGIFAVVVKAECTFHRPARYDDVLTLRTIVRRVTPAKIEHEYHLARRSAVGHGTDHAGAGGPPRPGDACAGLAVEESGRGDLNKD